MKHWAIRCEGLYYTKNYHGFWDKSSWGNINRAHLYKKRGSAKGVVSAEVNYWHRNPKKLFMDFTKVEIVEIEFKPKGLVVPLNPVFDFDKAYE